MLGEILTVGTLAGIERDRRGDGEGHVVAVGHPLQGHQRNADHHEHEHVEHVLGADHAAIEQRQSRHHEKHERRADHHPGDRPGVVGALEMGGADGDWLAGSLCPRLRARRQPDQHRQQKRNDSNHQLGSFTKVLLRRTASQRALHDAGESGGARCDRQQAVARPPHQGRENNERSRGLTAAQTKSRRIAHLQKESQGALEGRLRNAGLPVLGHHARPALEQMWCQYPAIPMTALGRIRKWSLSPGLFL